MDIDNDNDEKLNHHIQIEKLENFIINKLSYDLDDLIDSLSTESEFFVYNNHNKNVEFLLNCIKKL